MRREDPPVVFSEAPHTGWGGKEQGLANERMVRIAGKGEASQIASSGKRRGKTKRKKGGGVDCQNFLKLGARSVKEKDKPYCVTALRRNYIILPYS